MHKLFRFQLFSFLLIILILQPISGQENSRHSIKYGFGWMQKNDLEFIQTGAAIQFGYQYEIVPNRLRLNPHLNIGLLKGDYGGTQSITTMGFQGILQYDVVRANWFAFLIAGGIAFNYSTGYTTKPVYVLLPEGYYYVDSKEELVSLTKAGFYVGGGFRIGAPDKKVYVELLPVNANIGGNLNELYMTLGMGIKL